MLDETRAYVASIDDHRREAFVHLYEVIKENIPKGFEETFSYKMPGFAVPLSTYPDGYLKRKEEALPFINIAAQKNYIAIYHMGVVASPLLLEWFKEEYKERCTHKLDMGKSCIRFKKVEEIPYGLIADFVSKMSVEEWVNVYETARG